MSKRNHPLDSFLSETRRDFHMHPELAFAEVRTTKRIKEMLTEWGVEIIDLPELETGCVAIIRGKNPGKTLAIRADIDALPMQEMNDVEYRSKTDNCMHACGHDGHAAILLGTVKAVVDNNLAEEIKGNILFLFQPAEERVSGAEQMIKAKALEVSYPDRIIALHINPLHDVDEVGFHKGISHAAAERFTVKITGQGCHGAHPDKGHDPIVASAYFITAIQTIVSRGIGALDTGVVTVGAIHSGTVGNIIPEIAEMEGTIRTHDPKVREKVLENLTLIAKGAETMFGVKIELNTFGKVPSLKHDDEVGAWLEQITRKVLGEDSTVWRRPTMGAEDFALFTEKVPGTMMNLGCYNPEMGPMNMLHSPFFDMDESCLSMGVDIFVEAIKDYLK